MKSLKLLKWLSKAVIVMNLCSGVVQAGMIVVEHINACKCIKQMSYYIYDKTQNML